MIQIDFYGFSRLYSLTSKRNVDVACFYCRANVKSSIPLLCLFTVRLSETVNNLPNYGGFKTVELNTNDVIPNGS